MRREGERVKEKVGRERWEGGREACGWGQGEGGRHVDGGKERWMEGKGLK